MTVSAADSAIGTDDGIDHRFGNDRPDHEFLMDAPTDNLTIDGALDFELRMLVNDLYHNALTGLP